MAHFGVYLTNGSNKTLELPVAPEEIGLPVEMDNTQTTVADTGEVNIIGDRKLYAFSFDFQLPVDPKKATYTTATKLESSGQKYIDFIKAWQTSKKPGRIVVTGQNISIPVTIDKFEYKMTGGDEKVYAATLDVREWRSYAARKLPKPTPAKTVPKKAAAKPTPAKAVTIGCTVVVNGQLHRDSYGSGPGATERNQTRKVNFINKGAKCPYHVTTMDGGWRGWVEAKAVKVK